MPLVVLVSLIMCLCTMQTFRLYKRNTWKCNANYATHNRECTQPDSTEKFASFFFFFLILQINYLEYTLPKNNRKRLLILKIIVLNAKTLPCLLDSRNRVRSSETTDKDILGAERKEHAEHSQGKNMNNYSSLVILNSKKTSELRYSLPSLCEQRKNGH